MENKLEKYKIETKIDPIAAYFTLITAMLKEPFMSSDSKYLIIQGSGFFIAKKLKKVMKIKKGDIVKMSESLKQGLIKNGCEDHVIEFGNCVGIVEDKCYIGIDEADEVNIRWHPSGLRYAYFSHELVNVSFIRDKKIKKLLYEN